MNRHAQRLAPLACALAALAACGPAPQTTSTSSSAPPAASGVQPSLTAGTIVSATATDLVLKTKDGTAAFKLTPGTSLMAAHPGTLADIKPGSFLGTTNTTAADGTGQSTEVHVFPPGVKIGEGDRPMPAAPGAAPAAGASRMTNGAVTSAGPAAGGSRMTNGAVGTVAGGAAGVTMEVAYAGGKRRIVVPPDTPVMVMSSVTAGDLKPGAKALVGSAPGSQDASFVNLQP